MKSAYQPQGHVSDTLARQRLTFGLALAYRLFNVFGLVDSVVKGGNYHPHFIKHSAKPERVVGVGATLCAERSYISRVAMLERLSVEDELLIATRMRKGDESARNLLISANLGLVVMFAKKYARSGVSLLDLIAEGNLGLFRATRTFDPSRGFRFATYAKRPVTQAMVLALPRLSGAMTVPLSTRKPGGTTTEIEVENVKPLGNHATFEEEGQNTTRMPTNPFSEIDILQIAEEEKHEPVNQMHDLQLVQALRHSMESLTKREREIVAARYGLGRAEPETLASLARQFQISIERVRQIEKAGLKRLAHQFDQAGHTLETMLR